MCTSGEGIEQPAYCSSGILVVSNKFPYLSCNHTSGWHILERTCLVCTYVHIKEKVRDTVPWLVEDAIFEKMGESMAMITFLACTCMMN